MNAKVTDKTFAGRTAEQWREEARRCRQESYDSFERCDTDGFLSQWANDTMASRYSYCADVAENGGVLAQPALFKDGELVAEARNVKGRFGYTWVFDDENGNPVWLNESKAQKAEKRRQTFMQKHEGFTVGWAVFEARYDSRTGEVYADRRSLVKVETTDDTDFTEDHNNVY